MTLERSGFNKESKARQQHDGITIVVAFLKYLRQRKDIIRLEKRTLSWHGLATLTGPSGSGKTSLFRLMSGWFGGSIDVEHKFSGSVEPLHEVRLVGSHPSLLPWMTVERNIAVQCGAHNMGPVIDLLQAVGLASSVAKAFPYELSLGMYKRVELVIAMVQDPALLLLDEFFSSIDDDNKSAVLAFIQQHRPAALTLVTAHEKELRMRVGKQAFKLVNDPESGAAIDIRPT